MSNELLLKMVVTAATEAAVTKLQELNTQQAQIGRTAATVSAQQQSSLTDLYNAIDPVAKKLGQLDELEAKLGKSFKSGAIGQDDFDHLSSLLDGRRTALTATEQGVEKVSGAVKHLSLTSGGAAREYGVLIGELARGNYARLEGSIITLGNRIGLLPQLFSPIGAAIGAVIATIGVFAVAFAKGVEQDREFNREVQLTNGYLGLTRGQFNDLAASLGEATGKFGESRETLNLLAASGRFTGENIGLAASAVERFSEVSGKSTKEVAKDFDKLADSPLKFAVEADKSLHILTGAQYDHIKSLEDAGNKQAAVNEVLSLFNTQYAPKSIDQVGTMSRVWGFLGYEISSAWDSLKGFGRDATAEERLDKQKQKVNELRTALENFDKGGNNFGGSKADLQTQLASAQGDLDKQQKVVSDAQIAAQKKSAQDQRNAREVDARQDLEQLSKQYADRKDAELKEINKLQKDISDGLFQGASLKDAQTTLASMRAKLAADALKTQLETLSGSEEVRKAAGEVALANLKARDKVEEDELKTKLKLNQISYADYYAAIAQLTEGELDKQRALVVGQISDINAKLKLLQGGGAASDGDQAKINSLLAQRIKLTGELGTISAEQAEAQAKAGGETQTSLAALDKTLEGLKAKAEELAGTSLDESLTAIADKVRTQYAKILDEAKANARDVDLVVRVENLQAAKDQIAEIARRGHEAEQLFNDAKQSGAADVQLGLKTPDQARRDLSDVRAQQVGNLDELIKSAEDLHTVLGNKVVADLERIKVGIENEKTPFDQLVAKWRDSTGQMQQATADFANDLANQLTNLASKGKFSFRELFTSLSTEINRIGVDSLLAQTSDGLGLTGTKRQAGGGLLSGLLSLGSGKATGSGAAAASNTVEKLDAAGSSAALTSAEHTIEGFFSSVKDSFTTGFSNLLDDVSSFFGTLTGPSGSDGSGGLLSSITSLFGGGTAASVGTGSVEGDALFAGIGFATGGQISGPGGPTDDLIPIMASDGEYVLKADAVKRVGVGFLDALNHGVAPPSNAARRLATGGVVGDGSGGGSPLLALLSGAASGGDTHNHFNFSPKVSSPDGRLTPATTAQLMTGFGTVISTNLRRNN